VERRAARGMTVAETWGMTRDETVALWQKCESAHVAAITEGKSADEAHEKAKGIWNAWAHEMLCERTTLEKLGDFKIKRMWHRPGQKWEPSASGNISSNAWFLKSTADFSEFTFTDIANFSGFIFPGIVLFGYTTFIKGGKPLKCTIFKRQAYFNDAMFQLDPT
jgi:hypothetical protein